MVTPTKENASAPTSVPSVVAAASYAASTATVQDGGVRDDANAAIEQIAEDNRVQFDEDWDIGTEDGDTGDANPNPDASVPALPELPQLKSPPELLGQQQQSSIRPTQNVGGRGGRGGRTGGRGGRGGSAGRGGTAAAASGGGDTTAAASGGGEAGMAVGKPSRSTRGKSPVTTSARSSSAKARAPACRKGARVWALRKFVKTSAKDDDAALAALSELPDDFRLYGDVLSACGVRMYNITFDRLPAEHNTFKVPRSHLTAIKRGADEPEYSHIQQQDEDIADECENGLSDHEDDEGADSTKQSGTKKKSKKRNYSKESVDKYLKLPLNDRKEVKFFDHAYGPNPTDSVKWEILEDDEQIVEDPMKHPKEADPYNEDISWHPSYDKTDFNKVFFEHFFPDLKGKAALLDEYLDDVRCPVYHTVKSDKIKFHREGHEDPDYLLKLCITVMVAGSLEVHNGVDNLWKQGESFGLKPHSNFGQYIPKNYFKVFCQGFPMLWGDKKQWYVPRHDIAWDTFLPFISEYNAKRQNFLNVFYLVLDESMSEWRPKTTKTGGLPNITWEQRKPKDLVTMIRNAVECITGIFVNHDVVQGPYEQSLKDYVGEVSNLPQGEKIQVHVAEVLRQAENAGVTEGGWVGGDAWFGSINSCVELKKRLGLYSTFIVKQNLNYYPMQVLRDVLLTRYPKRPAGHWAVMKATISGVDLYIMAYAWSSKGIAYFVSSCGTTIRHEVDYRSCFEDGFGNTDSKSLPRPSVAHFLYEFLPLIDEHNKARQNALHLEGKWPTKNCWFRLVTTFVGMAVVDVHRWDRSMRNAKASAKRSLQAMFDDNFEEDRTDIRVMADLISKPLRLGKMRFREGVQPTARASKAQQKSDDEERLVRYVKDGKLVNKDGKAYQRSCYTCRVFGETHNTQWACRICNMPLCKTQRRGENNCCINFHLESDDPSDGCVGHFRETFIVPEANLRYRELPARKASRRVQGERRKDRLPKRQKKGNESTKNVTPV